MHHFTIDAVADPQTLPRLAGFFGQRAIAPAALTMRVEGERMKVEVLVAEMPDSQASIAAAKLGETCLVVDVDLERVAAAGARAQPEKAKGTK